MEDLDCWQLCHKLSVVQAALLVAGENPSSTQAYVERWEPHKRPPGYEAAKAAISNALRDGVIEGDYITLSVDSDDEYSDAVAGSIDVAQSRVDVASLRRWLSSHGYRAGIFFQPKEDAPDYLDPDNPRYAPKLAAAIRAWQAVTDSTGKHPKQALVRWLFEHAAEFGLTYAKGKVNRTAIGEIAKVANWQPKGGAPKTPGK